jgi:hypothetical protein
MYKKVIKMDFKEMLLNKISNVDVELKKYLKEKNCPEGTLNEAMRI